MAQKGYRRAIFSATKRAIVQLAIMLRKFYTVLRIALLLLLLVGFSVAGGLVFRLVEAPEEQATINQLKAARAKMLDGMFIQLTTKKGTLTQEENDKLLKDYFSWYKYLYKKAIQKGTFLVNGEGDPIWTFAGSTYFCVTTFTQLGFGNLAPSSLLGKVVAVLYACTSIPLGTIVFGDLGNQINELLSIGWNFCYWSVHNIQSTAHEDDDQFYRAPAAQSNTIGHRRGLKRPKPPWDEKTDNTQDQAKGMKFANKAGKMSTASKMGRDFHSRNENTNNYDSSCFDESKERRVSGQLGQNGDLLCKVRKSAVPKSYKEENIPSYKPPAFEYGQETQNLSPISVKTRLRSSFEDNLKNRDTIISKEAKSGACRVERFFKLVLSSPCCPTILKIAYLKQRLLTRYVKTVNQNYPEKKEKKKRKDGSLSYPKNTNNNKIDYVTDEEMDDSIDNEALAGSGDDNLMTYEEKPVIIGNLILSILYVILGTTITCIVEEWPYTDGAWFLVVSVLTVGYGDITPSNKEFLAMFLPFLILGIALYSNIIGTAMAFMTNNTIRIADIARDVYRANIARSQYTYILKRGMRARRWWMILRNHVYNGIPTTLVEESNEYKRKLLQEEKEWIKRALRIYFKRKCVGPVDPQTTPRYLDRRFVLKDKDGGARQMTLVIDKATAYQKPKKPNIFKRMHRANKRRYHSFKNYMVKEPAIWL